MVLTTSQAFDIFKSRLELSATLQDAVTSRHRAVRSWLESFDKTIETKLIGSLQRMTRIQPIENETFDIDILVVLGSFDHWSSSGGITPTIAIQRVETAISANSRYKKMGPETDSPAIILEYSDNIIVELIPAYKDNIGHFPEGTPLHAAGRAYWIPRNGRWVIADYDFDADYIIKLNRLSDGFVVPSIKMLKAIKRNLFPQMQSYHLEVISAPIIFARAFYRMMRKTPNNYADLITDFFCKAKNAVLNNAAIRDSNSGASDSYLTMPQKQLIANSFNRIAGICQAIHVLGENEAWKSWHKIIGSPFPA